MSGAPRIVPTGLLVGPPGRDGSNVLPDDAAVAQAVTAGTSTPAALNSLYAPAGRSNFVGFGGDSITALNGNGINLVGDNWNGYVPALSLGRILDSGTRHADATAGFTIEDWITTWLPQVLALTGREKPAYFPLLLGTNNMPAGTFNLATAIAHYTSILTSLRGASIEPIPCTIPPRGDDATANGNVQKFNGALTRLALQMGLHLLDFHSALVDPATGNYRSGYDLSDHIHPSASGFRAMANAVSAKLASILPEWTPRLTNSIADTANIIGATHGLFQTSGGGLNFVGGNSGVGAGWDIFGGSPTVSLQNDGLIPGKWQRIIHDSANNSVNAQHTGSSTAPTVGHRYACAIVFRTAGIEAAGHLTYDIGWNFKDGSNTVIQSAAPVSGWTIDLGGSAGVIAAAPICVAYMETVAPTGAVVLQPSVDISASGTPGAGATIDIGQVCAYDLDA